MNKLDAITFSGINGVANVVATELTLALQAVLVECLKSPELADIETDALAEQVARGIDNFLAQRQKVEPFIEAVRKT